MIYTEKKKKKKGKKVLFNSPRMKCWLFFGVLSNVVELDATLILVLLTCLINHLLLIMFTITLSMIVDD